MTSRKSTVPTTLRTHANPDLSPNTGPHPRWNSAPYRRHGFHNLHRIARYTMGFRAGQVMDLGLSSDISIAARADVRALTGLPWFSAIVVIEGNRVLHEAYAPDFGPDGVHSIMSVSKLSMNLILGRLWDEGRVRLDQRVGSILPWIGPGYHGATVADVANMNVENDYDEDYANPACAAFRHEIALGMRLPNEGEDEPTNQSVLASIGLAPGAPDTINRHGHCLYKSANTEVLAFVAEAAGQRPLRGWLADLADAAGFEGVFHVGCDRAGFPILNGGICLTARDLCRYGAVLARRGLGVDGREFGSARFIAQTLAGGVPMPSPRAHLRYSNQSNTNGTWLGHGGYGGQYLVANPETGRVACFLSVLTNAHGYDADYYPPVIAMLSDICAG